MKTEVQKVSACRVKVIVEATAEEIDPIYKGVRAAFTSQVKLPGFRPGKAPWERIEKLYSKNIQDELNQRVLGKLAEATRNNDEIGHIAAVVDIVDVKHAKTEGASAGFVIDVEPTFTLPEIASIQVKKVDETISDEEFEERIADVRKMASSFRECTAEDVATEDDLVAIAFTSDLNKDELADSAKHYAADEEYWVQLREDAFIPGLKDTLLGKKLGEEAELTATYPADYRVTDIAGKTVNYKITLKTMRKQVAADDETLLKRFGAKDMDDFREQLRSNLEQSKRYTESQRASQDLCAAIENAVSFDLPERPLERAIYDELSMDPAKPLENFKGTEEELKAADFYAAATDRATKLLRRAYVLLQFARERGVKLEASDIDQALDNLARNVGIKKNELARRLQDNGRMDDFLDRELATKMLTQLLDECAVL